MPESIQPLHPQCIASANDLSPQTDSAAIRGHSNEDVASRQAATTTQSFFKHAQWSPDGTCVLTSSEDNLLSTYILPPDLLDPTKGFLNLFPYATHVLPEPTYATAPHPLFTLSSPHTALLLTAPRDHPLQLTNALNPSPSPPCATYPLINPYTEAYLPAHALAFTGGSGTHFVAAAPSLLAVFDVSRPGDPPLAWLPTIPSRRSKRAGGGVGMKGIIGALGVSGDGSGGGGGGGGGVLAAGTYSRWVGLYADEGRGECMAVFPLAEGAGGGLDAEAVGRGVTQLLWTPCGRYLLVVERVSDAVLVYDVRVAGKLVTVLKGRRALTNQRMGVSLAPSPGNDGRSEVWAGGTDGVVRVWGDVTGREGVQSADWEWEAHSDAVSNTLVHSSGTIAATCAGQREVELAKGELEDSDEDFETNTSSGAFHRRYEPRSSRHATTMKEKALDRSLKVWAL